jgi:hypothetical protein
MKCLTLCCFVLFTCNHFLFADGVLPIGSGTDADPYLIETLDNLLYLSTNEYL